MDIHIQGLDDVMRDLRKARDEIQEKAYVVLKEKADDIVDDMKMTVPVRTMKLFSTIRARVSRKKLIASIYAGGKVKGVDVGYATYVEFGTRRESKKNKKMIYVRAQPFFYSTARKHEKEVERRLKNIVLNSIKKGGAK